MIDVETIVEETPLIWTSKGNLPIADLIYTYYWMDSPEALTFVEEYRLGDEIVKGNSHSYLKKGLEVFPALEQD